MEKWIKERIEENNNIFTEEEINILNNMFAKKKNCGIIYKVFRIGFVEGYQK